MGIAACPGKRGALEPVCPPEPVIGIPGLWTTVVWVANGVNEGTTGAIGVLGWGSRDVLVADAKDGIVDVELSPGHCGIDVEVLVTGIEVLGCKR